MFDVNATQRTVRVSLDTHKQLVEHVVKSGRKIGLWVDEAVLEKIEREKKKGKKSPRNGHSPE